MAIFLGCPSGNQPLQLETPTIEFDSTCSGGERRRGPEEHGRKERPKPCLRFEHRLGKQMMQNWTEDPGSLVDMHSIPHVALVLPSTIYFDYFDDFHMKQLPFFWCGSFQPCLMPRGVDGRCHQATRVLQRGSMFERLPGPLDLAPQDAPRALGGRKNTKDLPGLVNRQKANWKMGDL